MGSSVAFKCTYNDGGEGLLVGFAGTCSKDNIARNVEAKRAWCSSLRCDCRQYYDKKGLKGAAPLDPCYESKLFRIWEFGAGGYDTVTKDGPIPLTHSEPGKFAILTTRFPGDTESQRRIIGIFQIVRIDNQNNLIAAPEGRIRLPLEEARELFFWAYHSNSAKKPDWRTGLFRYLEDDQVHRILADIASTVRDENTTRQLNELI